MALLPFSALAGPYAPAAGIEGTTAIPMDDPAIAGWATGWRAYLCGDAVDSQWQIPEKALGKASGDAFDIVSLGRGGSLALTFFPSVIVNGPGPDLVVFENGFQDTFLELAYVEVSSDGLHFARFENDSLTPAPTSNYVDPTDINGFAGKYRQGFGTPFDLEDLSAAPEVLAGLVKLDSISCVRLVDVTGDGSCLDASGDLVYDPYPTTGSAGFDLDAMGYMHFRLAGDVNGDSLVTLADAVLALKIAARLPISGSLSGDCNGDGKVGLEEAAASLFQVAATP